MKKLSVLLALLVIGCATPQIPVCPVCPSEDAYTIIKPGYPIIVPKGFFDDPENWMTEKQIQELIKENNGL